MGNGKIRKRENKYTQVSNDLIRDESLSLRAIGLYTKINSYLDIPDWELYKSFLISKCKEGRESFNSAWNELKEHGYLIQYKIRDEKGKICYEYELSDISTTYGFPVDGSATHGKPVPIYNKEKNKTILNNKNKSVSLSTKEQTDELTNIIHQSSIDTFEDESLKEMVKEVITELYDDTGAREVVKKIAIYHIDEALRVFREQQEKVAIKNPKKYFKLCLISAIKEAGLKGLNETLL